MLERVGTSGSVLFLMGATACGKTALSLSLAEKLNAEIISVDSALVYRGMDIGTAKPSAQEQARVKHHLIDICEPWQAYSAANFCQDAVRAIDDIHQRGKRALLVGGTMLYFKALEQGLAELPDADEAIRASLLQEASEHGWAALHQQLESVDPQAAARIHPNDPQRLQRALEVYRITGTSMSELQANTHSFLQAPPVKFALIPKDRAWLHERIERRFKHMVSDGFLDEMQRLRRHGQLHADLPAMRSVGYRQAWEYMDACEANDAVLHHKDHQPTWVDKAVAATRQLAKRQLTWLRGMENVNPITCDRLPLPAQESTVLDVVQLQTNQ